MSNPYYTYSGVFIPGILARAEALAAEYTSVQGGFAILAVQGTDSGSANSYTITTKGGQNGIYADGMIVEFKAANSNTGACLITVDSGASVALTNSNGQSLTSGVIAAGTWYRLLYNSTYSAWTLIAPTSLVTTQNTISTAAPVHKVGLTAAGGVSTACIPIDITFAIDQSIAPSWTGVHTFGNVTIFNAAAVFEAQITLDGNNEDYALIVNGGAGLGESFGLQISAGTNASDYALNVESENSIDYFLVQGEGSVIVGSPTGGGQGIGTINAQGVYINGTAAITQGASGANPANSITLSTTNGTATTFMRSDAAQALSQAIAPTWTGNHVFNGSGTPITINGGVNQLGLVVNGNTNTSLHYLAEFLTGQGAGFSHGVLIQAATNASDIALNVLSANGTSTFLQLKGDGSGALGSFMSWSPGGQVNINGPNGAAALSLLGFSGGFCSLLIKGGRASTKSWELIAELTSSGTFDIYSDSDGFSLLRLNAGLVSPVVQAYGPSAAGLVDMTPDHGTFAVTVFGLTTALTGTATWARNGNIVSLLLPNTTTANTSGGGGVGFTGLPAQLQPSGQRFVPGLYVNYNGGLQFYTMRIANSGTMFLASQGGTGSQTFASGSGFTFVQPTVLTYHTI